MKNQQEFVAALRSQVSGALADDLNEQQLTELYQLCTLNRTADHPISLKATVGFWNWHYYFSFVAGRDRRKLTRREHQLGLVMKLLLIVAIASVSTLLGLLLIYLGKSGLGIDVFPNFSFGIWTWFIETFPRLAEPM